MTPITIAYVTGRKVPRWEWFVESLFSQTTPEQREQIQLVVIDGKMWGSALSMAPAGFIPLASPARDLTRGNKLSALIDGRFPDVLHIPPKPCAWQGPFRQTKGDWFCAGNTRNTAFIVAKHSYIVFVDDLSVLMPGWFDQVLHAAKDQYIVCGMYKKVKKLCPTAEHIHFEDFPPGVDSRWNYGSDNGVVPWHGSGMFGCSFGLPLEAALEVDGNDRATDGQGAEDYDFGIRLERAGWPFFLNRNMLTLESEEDHYTEDALPRQSRTVSNSDFLPKNYTGNTMSDHVMLYRVRNDDRILPLLGDDLRVLRKHYQETGLVPIPAPNQLNWRDNSPLTNL